MSGHKTRGRGQAKFNAMIQTPDIEQNRCAEAIIFTSVLAMGICSARASLS